MWLSDGRDLIRLSRRAGTGAELDEVVRALRASDVRIHQEVLTQLLPRVRLWVRALVGPRGAPEDIVQEALCQIAEALFSFEGRASLSTFAHRITVRVASRRRRRRAPPGELEPEQVASAEPSPAESVERRARLERLYVHLDRMQERRRVALVLCDIEGLSPSEAAEVQGCSPTAMRNRLFHARAELRERVLRDPMLEGGGPS